MSEPFDDLGAAPIPDPALELVVPRPIIRAERVTYFIPHRLKLWAGRLVLRNVSFSIGRGRVHGFLGTNASGVSTLFRILLGLLAPQRGAVYMCGARVDSPYFSVAQAAGFVPQESGLYGELTVQEHLHVLAAGYGFKDVVRASRVDEVIEFMDLGSRRHQRCGSLSKGMRRRVEVARALLHDPQILILDEPAADLDPRTRAGLWERLRALRARGMTIVLSSHILGDVEELCDDITLMHEGRVRYTGSLERFLLDARALDETPAWLIECTDPDGRLARALGDREGVLVQSLPGHATTLRVTCAPNVRGADLLEFALACGVPIDGFRRAPVSLADEYLRLTSPAPEDGSGA